MTATAQEVVRGAAVVIDDRIGEDEDAIQRILNQLEAAEVPTVRMRELPSTGSLVHWKQFGLIVLDWELSYATADEETSVPPGVTVPSELAADVRSANFDFIRSLLDETALPIIIASNADIDSIRSELTDAFPDQVGVLEERLHVFSKSELEVSLFESIGSWIDSRPALKALRAWNRAYVEAEIAAFHQFSRAEEDWVVAVQRAAIADGASFAVTLRDLLASNTVNRIGPLPIEMPDAPSGALQNAAALRQVLHFSAVIPDAALDADEPGTGDLYVRADAIEPYAEIRILLTPECDLARGDSWRFTYLPATRKVPTASRPSNKRVESIGKPDRLHLVTALLTPAGDEYDIALKEWESTPVRRPRAGADAGALDPDGTGASEVESDGDALWPGFKRVGRLLDPYLTHIQQNFALATIRKGLPRLPDDFFAGWTSE